jgi:hypothetical protein
MVRHAMGRTETGMTGRTILPTENTAWGFWGTMGEHAAEAWPLAFAAILDATGTDPDSVRAFLDSRYGRHFADEVTSHLHAGRGLAEAIAAATATWMGWRIGRRTSRETGILAGLPYLTGFVISEGIAADAARD